MGEFKKFAKIPRMANTQLIITEKIDGTNAQIEVPEDPDAPLLVGSRNRYITPGKTSDNFGFAAWVDTYQDKLRLLGPGLHYGEWWGPGIGRGYLPTAESRRWSLFNTSRPLPEGLPSGVGQVPVLYHRQLDLFHGNLEAEELRNVIIRLEYNGSVAAPGFMKPEGVVINIGGHLYKYVFDKGGPSPEETETA